MSDSNKLKLSEIHSWDEIPEFFSEDEEADFWETHGLGEEFLAQMKSLEGDVMPSAHSVSQSKEVMNNS